MPDGFFEARPFCFNREWVKGLAEWVRGDGNDMQGLVEGWRGDALRERQSTYKGTFEHQEVLCIIGCGGIIRAIRPIHIFPGNGIEDRF